MQLVSINPATGQVLNSYDELSALELSARLARAAAAFKIHKRSSFSEREGSVRRLAQLLETSRDVHARRMTEEMGKTLASALAEVDKCVTTCRHYADHARVYLVDESIATDAALSYVRHLPLGPVLGVMPWNFPYWQVFRWAVPTVMAGNVVLLKHSSNVSGCSLAIQEAFLEAGFAEGVFQSLLINSNRVAGVIADSRVVALSLTGSDAAGAAVATQAGAHLKKCVLELGGSDPFIVMPSANLDGAIAAAVSARIINNGQSCIAAKRFIVHEDCYAKFLERFVERFAALKVGDPLQPGTDVGPLATAAGRDHIEQQVQQAVAGGARLLCGGKRGDIAGFFYLPTVLVEIPPSAAIHQQEVFGPVALVYRVASIDAAIRLANHTPYGLASSVWTQDESEQRQFIEELEAGLTFVNASVASDPRLPFGGVKSSGYGRELGRHGILEFVNAKTVYVR